MRQPRILFVTPELAPWAKAGGLGEVSRDLPLALAAAGVDARVLVPAYPALVAAFPDARCVAELSAAGSALPPARLLEARGPVPLYLLDCPECYARPGLYQSPDGVDWPDNALRYGLLSRSAALLGSAASPLLWRPHVLHCHDWPCGLAPAYLAHLTGEHAATVMTVHNMAYQGNFPAHVLDALGLPPSAFTVDGIEFYGNVSFLKAGLGYATRVTTVSPTYAREIRTPELGFGLDRLLARRGADLTGISNGIDASEWNPASDPHLARPYDLGRLDLKRENKLALQRALGLDENAGQPLFGMVSRLVWQKGIDILLESAAAILDLGAQIAVHGEGERDACHALSGLAARHPGRVAVRIGFEEALNHRVVAGADAFLLPSRYEPCGLTQLHSMRYGTLPIAHRTGGLADWVVDAGAGTPAMGATGFAFSPLTPRDFVAAIARALDTYHAPGQWRALQWNAMERDYGWTRAVPAYLSVYRSAAAARWPRSAATDRARPAPAPMPAARTLRTGDGLRLLEDR
jgi:starch synthase